MDRFKFLNFHTRYECKGDLKLELGNYACFSDVFHLDNDHPHNQYTIHVYKGMTLIETGLSNGCFLELRYIYKHISVLKHITKFKYSITEAVDKQLNPYYSIDIDLNAPLLIHKFVLTWIRALYEFPYCIYLPEVYKLKQEFEFKYINVFNILNLISATYYRGDSIHMFLWPGYIPNILKYNGIRTKINKLIDENPSGNLSSIFDSDEENIASIDIQEDFMDNKGFNDRKKIYLDLYKKIKYKNGR